MSRVLKSPLTWYFFVSAFAVAAETYLWANNKQPSSNWHGLVNYLQLLIIACWVQLDSVKRRTPFPSDWVFLVGFIYAPIYAITSRGWRGFGLVCLVIGGSLALGIAGAIAQTIIHLSR